MPVLALLAVVPSPVLVSPGSSQDTEDLKFPFLALGYQANNPAGDKVAAGDTTLEASPAQSPLLAVTRYISYCGACLPCHHKLVRIHN